MKMLERPSLVRRGWTKALMRDFLPEPDDYRETRHGYYHSAHQWKEDTIIRRGSIGTCEAAHAIRPGTWRLERLAVKAFARIG